MSYLNKTFIIHLAVILTGFSSFGVGIPVLAERLPILPEKSSIKTYYVPPDPAFPAYGGISRTQKVQTTVSGRGLIGELVKDPLTGEYDRGFHFPNRPTQEFLTLGAFWFGGIMNGDTVVSVGHSREVRDDSVGGYWTVSDINELFPPNARDVMASTAYYFHDNISTYHIRLTDSFTQGLYNINPWYMPNPHKPMHLDIVYKAHTVNRIPYRNIILLDFTVTNRGQYPIDKAYAGMFIDGDVCGDCYSNGQIWGGTDDLAGSLREYAMGYIMDNDGDPSGSRFTADSPLDALALQVLRSYPEVPDTNFNWWGYSTFPNIDYGPRTKEMFNDPYRPFGFNISGTPTGDANKYYMLSHDEWDFDQCMSATAPWNDTIWVQPDSVLAMTMASGFDTRFVLSVGPVNLRPDSSARFIYALIGSEFIHIDPSNKQNLNLDVVSYYDQLFFDILKDNATYSEAMVSEILDPLAPPLGLHLEHSEGISTLRWDDWVFPSVTGYVVEIKEVPPEALIATEIIRPEYRFDDILTTAITYSTDQPFLTLDMLENDKVYAAVVRHNTAMNRSASSRMVAISMFDRSLKLQTPQLTYRYVPHKLIGGTTFSWHRPDSGDVAYYKLYRATDSITAHNRYYPFAYNSETPIPLNPVECTEGDDSVYCYYAYPVYDTVFDTVYIDSFTSPGDYYWISAVFTNGLESNYSDLIKIEETIQPTKEIVVVLGAEGGEKDFIHEDSIVAYYTRVLEGYDFDLYYWRDSNLVISNCTKPVCTDWKSLAEYKYIFIEEFTSPAILNEETESAYRIFSRLMNNNRTMVYFGTPEGTEEAGIANYTEHISYHPTSFEHLFLGLDSSKLVSWFGSYQTIEVLDTLGGFTKAQPAIDGFPELSINLSPGFIKESFYQIFAAHQYLPLTSTIYPKGTGEVLYRYQSAFPLSSRLQNESVGVYHQIDSINLYTFGFHLWAIDETDAANLVDLIMNRFTPSPPPLPEEYQLVQNYPNPFNGTTVISFDLPQPTSIDLTVYNIVGQKVNRLLSSRTLTSGTHFVEWDGTNEQGEAVASGVYFYRLTTDEVDLTKKMLLLK